jgi:hypothetical protein
MGKTLREQRRIKERLMGQKTEPKTKFS